MLDLLPVKRASPGWIDASNSTINAPWVPSWGACAIREEAPWPAMTVSGRWRSALQAAQLRLLLGFLHSERLTAGCPLVLKEWGLLETIGGCFRVST